MKLTQRTIDTLDLPAGKTEAILFDDDLPGFGIRIRRGGTRTFVFQYKLGARHRRITLGKTAALSLVQARKIAGELYANVKLGRDPAGEKDEAKIRVAETVGAALEFYLPHKKANLRPRSYVETERHLLRHCKPLHKLQLAQVNRRTIAARLAAITTNNGPSAANRVRDSLAAFFSWAIQQGWIDSNPVVGTSINKERARDRVLSDHELAAIWSATESNSAYDNIIRLLMLTGCRRNEIGGLQWSEVFNDKIVLPSTRTKNHREHIVFLTPPAQVILAGRERKSEFVFGRRPGRPFGGFGKAKQQLDQRMRANGIELENWSLHDLRRALSTHMHDELGIQPHVVEAVINHVGHKAGTPGVYNKATYAKEKAIALARYAEFLLAAVEGRDSKVLAFPTSA